jgi:saccharopine dehydrogenase (NAD+, L-lysine-forming)
MKILLLGGYGATGKPLARLLLKETSVDLVIAGRNEKKALDFSRILQEDFPGRSIMGKKVDASNPESIGKACLSADMVLLAATIPESAGQVALAALHADCHYLDILFLPDVFNQLQSLDKELIRQNKLFITQAGCHPGFVAPLVRYAAKKFDRIDRAVVSMTMNAHFENASSAKELIEESYDFQPEIYKSGRWQKVSYKESLLVDFGEPWGSKECLAMPLDEMKDLPDELGLRELGAYISGFNWFVDNIVFSLVYFAGKIKKGLWSGFFQRLLKWGIDRFSPDEEWIVFRVDANGISEGSEKSFSMTAHHQDGYYFTAVCVVALIKQFLHGKLNGSGVKLMGSIVEPEQLIKDMQHMNIRFNEN